MFTEGRHTNDDDDCGRVVFVIRLGSCSSSPGGVQEGGVEPEVEEEEAEGKVTQTVDPKRIKAGDGDTPHIIVLPQILVNTFLMLLENHVC